MLSGTDVKYGQFRESPVTIHDYHCMIVDPLQPKDAFTIWMVMFAVRTSDVKKRMDEISIDKRKMNIEITAMCVVKLRILKDSIAAL